LGNFLTQHRSCSGNLVKLPYNSIEESARAYKSSAAIHPKPVFNAKIDRTPQVIARCVDVADVINAVGFARQQDVDLAIRGGAHNGGGLGTCDGMVIDLSPMRGVRIDPEARLAYVGGGAQFGDVDHAAHAFGLATPAGIISTTGVGGLTLGGGLGHLTRKYGLTIDNLAAADVVLADGSFVTAGADHNPDLFWALRGGGGNFGIVTQFTFRLHPGHPRMLYGLALSSHVGGLPRPKADRTAFTERCRAGVPAAGLLAPRRHGLRAALRADSADVVGGPSWRSTRPVRAPRSPEQDGLPRQVVRWLIEHLPLPGGPDGQDPKARST
jgi:hypothetical protein